jgi:ATP-binding cassette subfamily B multidrug efflux pump
LHGLIRIFSRTTLLHTARRIEWQIREELYARLLELDLHYFNRERTGDLISRFSNDLTNVRMLIGFGILNVINTFVIYLAALSLMVRISPGLTIAAILPFPLMILVVKRISAAMFRRSKRAQEELARLTSAAEENVSAAAVVKAYCREEASVQKFAEVSGHYMESNMRVARLRGLMIPVMAATGTLGTLIVLLAGGQKVVEGVLTLGDFVAFSGYLAMLIWPTIILGWILNLIQRGAASMSRLNEVLLAEATVKEAREPVVPDRIAGEIELRNLSFSYDASPVLSEVSLSIPAGSSLGIVGPVGAGKSTLVKLLARLYQVADGSIFIDGIDINRLSLRSLRSATGFVPQESFLFSRTISANISFGKEGTTEEEIREASRLANFHDDVERFPDGYSSMVGERGITLSGGQKQRASIARALLKSPSILILDDPLSAVDTKTEEEILTSLSGYSASKTVIIVSHRLTALRDCDTIVYLDAGRIVEKGSHKELLDLGGRYAKVHKEQEIRRELEKE